MTLSPETPAQHPMIAVVDSPAEADPSPTVVWHVQTDPAATSFAAILSGAWLVSEDAGDVPPARLPGLLRGAAVLRSDGFTAAHPEEASQEALSEAAGVIQGSGGEALAALAGAIEDAKEEVAAAMKAEIDQKPSLKAVRFPAVTAEDPERLAEAYRGEGCGRAAWSLARAVADLVEKWHDIENARRSRSYLKARFGEKVRPLPLPELVTTAEEAAGD